MKITHKLEKQEKRLKEEKQQMAVLALASLQTSSSTLKQCEEVQEKPKKKKKQNAQVPQENEMEKPKEQLVNGDLEETEGNASPPKSKKSWEEAVVNNAAEVGSRKVSSKEEQPQRGYWQQ